MTSWTLPNLLISFWIKTSNSWDILRPGNGIEWKSSKSSKSSKSWRATPGGSATSTDPGEVGGCQDGGRVLQVLQRQSRGERRHQISMQKRSKINRTDVFSIFFLWWQHGETEDKGLLSNALKILLPGQDEGGLDLRNFHFQEQTIKTLRKDTKMIYCKM